ncbi:ArsR/SmtB family transcription factor [Paenibacillus camerounensis]|uniref:ArsR/SmtB family transcription factor n=1 Tax=Paenibacillus camerounensis TaxID=1243663 RepID=UPI0005A982CC|nr:winged helix-turn-helix domain-containing protein [Paenibacillus camerounensis]
MNYTVEVDFAPMYECIASLNAFLYKQNHNAMDAGKLWVREVQDRFAPVQLQKMREVLSLAGDFNLNPYIWSCPGERTVSGFLSWFEGMTTGDLYELSGRFGQSVPANLPELRSSAAEMLRVWDNGYFSGIDPQILTGLQSEADSRRETLSGGNGMEGYEQATAGMRLYPAEQLKRVILIPQYHARPLVTSAFYDEYVFTSYTCDVLPPEEGRPAAPLLRLTRALSDETRLYILRLLTGRQLSFTEIVKHVGLSKSTIHYHLIALRAAGLVIAHVSGKSTSYSLRLEALQGLPQQIGTYLES